VKSDRLLAILLLLQTRGRTSARELAAELEVTERTIYRDLSALSTAGVPVYTERGRNGGCALLAGYRADLTGLTAAEARALFMFGGRGAPAGPDTGGTAAGAEADLRQALRKLLTALPAPQRPAAQAARDRTVVDARGWHQGAESTPALATVQEAVWQTRRLLLRYRSSDSPDIREYTVDPYGLLVKAGHWYLIAAIDDEPRVYRVSRVDSAVLLGDPARRPPGLDLQTLWDQLRRRFEERGPGTPVRLRVRSREASRLARLAARQLATPAPDPLPRPDGEGWVTLELRFVALGAARAVIAGFGGDVEVVTPARLRRDLVMLARELLARYEPALG
jgi:predicted DNA-binding transcriptional regulator YafY